MKKIVSVLFFILLGFTAAAAPRSLSEARKVAQQFMLKTNGHQIKDLENSPIDTRAQHDNDNQPYYIFNDAEAEGFVIVSGSDLTSEVIGYSAHGQFPVYAEDLPENLKSWLTWVGETTDYLELHPEVAIITRGQASAVEPLTGGITWGQDYPYNYYCPALPNDKNRHCATGCVATAIAQVICYHLTKNNASITGKGQHFWEENGRKHNVNYAANKYSYEKMPFAITQNTSLAEVQEVAKLMYHIGVGVNMMYGEESGALLAYAEDVLIGHFNFNSRIRYVERRDYNFAEWNYLLQNELQNERPILYGGQSNKGGHAFLIEGSDEDGLYYINWGWEGLYNGFFDINLLDPDKTGNAYVFGQNACINVCMEEGVGEVPSPLHSTTELRPKNYAYSLGDTIRFEENKIFNLCTQSVSGSVGFALSKDEHIINTFKLIETGELIGFDFLSNRGQTTEPDLLYPLPTDLTDGLYQLWLYFSPQFEDTICRIPNEIGSRPFIWLEVSAGKAQIVSSKPLKLSITDWSSDSEDVFTSQSKLHLTVKNESDEIFAGYYVLTFTDSQGKKAATIESEEGPLINPGESAIVTFNLSFDETGIYDAKVTTVPINQTVKDVNIDNFTKTIEVKRHQTLGAEFKLLETYRVISEQGIIPNSKIKIRFTLSNSGTPYDGEFGLYFYTSSVSQVHVAFVSSPASFGTTDKDSIEVEFVVPDLTENRNYYIRGAYKKGDGFAMFNTAAEASNRVKINIGTTSIDAVTTDDAYAPTDYSTADVFNILGKRVSVSANGRLPQGIYIINGKKTIIRKE